MDADLQTENSQEIERLHNQLAAESDTGTAAKDDLGKNQETQRENGGALDSSEDSFLGDVVECEENLRRLLAAHADGVRRNTAKELAPIAVVEPDLVDRIADNAGMSENLQKLFSHHGAKILAKHRVAKYVGDGGALIYGIISYLAERAETKRDIAALLKKHSPQHGAQRDSATGGIAPIETHAGSLNVERPPIPKITT